MINFAKIINLKALNENSMDPRVEKYASFLEKDANDLVDRLETSNKDAFKVLNSEFAQILRANPSLLSESYIVEMSRYEAMDLFNAYADFLESDVGNSVGGKVGDQNAAESITNNLVDLAKNIKHYPELFASIVFELKDTPFYKS